MATLSIARAYQYSFQTRPNVTLALTGGTLNALGDFVAQLSQILVGFFFAFQYHEDTHHLIVDEERTRVISSI